MTGGSDVTGGSGGSGVAGDRPTGPAAHIYRLDNPVQNYAWGSMSVIPDLLGVEPTGEPVAELWLGAHPAAPSRVIGTDGERTLLELIDEQPEAMLGKTVGQRFGQLPFLLKILAVARPLSLQAHPSLSQARAGFAAENAAGIPIDSAGRNYKDANHKPEQICALTDFEGFCGFRPVAETAGFLDALDTPLLAGFRARLVAAGGLRDVVTDLLTRSPEGIARILDELVPAAERLAQAGGRWAAEAGWIVRLDGDYPGDHGAVMALLLNLVHLRPGQALFLHAGELHAYLHGVGVEVLANSDNVLRGGLTHKHIDVAALLGILEVAEDVIKPLDAVPAVGGESIYPSSVADFRLTRLDLADAAVPVVLAEGTPRILLCTEGSATVTASDGESVRLPRGAGVFVAAGAAVAVAASESQTESQTESQIATVFVALPNCPEPRLTHATPTHSKF